MQTLLQDVRYALRSLLKRPGFALVAMLTIALGIGANTAIFSVVHAVLLSALPYRSADQLVTVWENNRKRGNDQNVINLGNFFDWKAQNQVFEDMATFFDMTANLTSGGEPEEIPTQISTPNLFQVLGVTPVLGRTFSEADGQPGAPRVAVLGFGLWQRRFGGDPGIIGKSIKLAELDYQVIGVAPRGFRNPLPHPGEPQLWRTIMAAQKPETRGTHFLDGIGRLRAGAKLAISVEPAGGSPTGMPTGPVILIGEISV